MHRLVLALVVPLALAACGSDAAPAGSGVSSSPGAGPTGTAGEPAGTKSFGDLARNHVDTPVEYPQTPPVGGSHAPNWQNCQFYDTAIPNERAVHSMEHGAVWLTYAPDLSEADRKVLSDFAATGDHILVSQYDGLPSPVVASAWGKQLPLSGVTDPGLQQFVDFFQSGPQTPEPGVTCRESTSETT